MSFQSDVSLEQAPIQRLLIVHLKLAELSTGKQLDENASTQELCEQILYFHSSTESDPTRSNTTTTQQEKHSGEEEAIQFTGLCSALYSLPSSIDPVQAKEDHTREIYLDNCCIVFEPLESNKDMHIVAVAQIARRPPHLSGSHGGTPSAVGAAIQRSHGLFCLLRGGGIHKRLAALAASNANANADANANAETCIYDGMDLLFKLRKQARRIEAKSARLSATDKEMEDELQTIQAELESLMTSLPIRSLREDLRIHYDAFLVDLAQLAEENGGPCRCLVQALPAPIALLSGSHVIASPPSALNPNAPQLDHGIQTLLERIGTQQGETLPRLFGISTFARGELLFTRMLQSESFVSNETACTLMGYLASFRFEMRKQHDRLTNSGGLTPPRTKKQPFRPLAALSFGTGLDEVQPPERPQTSKEGFLAPPSLSLLCPSDEGHDFGGCQDDDRVWAPLIDLPLYSCDDFSHDLPPIQTRVSLYDSEDLSFLLYILPPSDEQESDSSYKDLFHKAATQISTILTQIQASDERQSDGCSPLGHVVQMETRQWEQPTGCEVVFIDRSKQKLVLFSHLNQEADNNSNRNNERSRFFKSSAQSTQRSNSNFDCRHLLASHLSLDSVLAFEDVMNEVYQNQSAKTREDSRPIEICTFIPGGWIFANADRGRELYVLFDSKLYVTVADVQKAALQIWKELMGGWTDYS